MAPLNISAACGWEYPGTVAFNPYPANASEFECLSASSPVGPGYYETFNGASYLADAGLASGGGAGSSGLPDFVDSAGGGSEVIYSSPVGSFDVAESGSLATGGAI